MTSAVTAVQVYRKNRVWPVEVALVVPVASLPHDDEAALLDRHRANIAQACALAAAGARVHLFVDAPYAGSVELGEGASMRLVPRFLARALARDEAPSTRGSSGSWARGGPHLVAAALAVRPHAIHLFHALELKTLALASLAPVPVFAEYNGGGIPPSPIRRVLMRGATRQLAGLFFTSRAMGREFVAGGAVDRGTSIVAVPEVSSILPRVSDRAEARRSLGLAGDPLVLVVARIAAEKDPFAALAAFARIAAARPGARLVWAALGDQLGGALERRLRDEPALASRVELRYRVPRALMPRLYAAADVLLHTSTREVCGASFVEALGAGLPVAGSDIPAFRALARGGAARLCAVGDAQAFAEAALALAADPGARARAEARFDRALSYDAIARRKLRAYGSEDVATDY